ncbi:MAG TPA: GGDEF domain-containing protein [Burkholderiales bacterium]|jgi:diguanylate cyclase (GGDEF)-like protein|nr:GGDEF domain-containing protein [Burkholderiales bacterium]
MIHSYVISTIQLRALSPLIMPVAIIVIAALVVAIGRSLPASFAGFAVFGPYTVLLLGAAISLWFNRGRAFIVLLSLLIAFVGYRLTHDPESISFGGRAVFTALAVFVPLNILITLLVPERGISFFHNYRWLLLLITQVLLTAWVAGAGTSVLSGTAWHAMLEHWLVRPAPVPFLGRVLMAAAFGYAVYKAWQEHSPFDIGVAGALVAFFVACQWPTTPGMFAAFISAAGAILLLAVLQESHRMAFRDELTGLPGRRTLEERLVALGPAYAIAMVDVDHFKKFNDTHGHDIGDQVLKLVGARLAKLDGGGKAFRYGGEEFAVLFVDQTMKEVLPHLEALRQSIESYRMAVRTDERRSDSRPGNDRRSTTATQKNPRSDTDVRAFRKPDQVLSITVSIGVAECDEYLNSPAKVIRAADEALYRAKEKGRNQVSQ